MGNHSRGFPFTFSQISGFMYMFPFSGCLKNVNEKLIETSNEKMCPETTWMVQSTLFWCYQPIANEPRLWPLAYKGNFVYLYSTQMEMYAYYAHFNLWTRTADIINEQSVRSRGERALFVFDLYKSMKDKRPENASKETQ